MNPEIWGPKAWLFLHSITLAYPNNPTETDKNNYKVFFNTLQHVLPCQKCSYNFQNNFKNNSIDNHLDSKKSLVKWLIGIHNSINEENNKSIMTYDEVVKYYKQIYNISKDNSFNKDIGNYPLRTNNKFLLFALLVLIVILAYYYYKKYFQN
jgi:hypothetical protein